MRIYAELFSNLQADLLNREHILTSDMDPASAQRLWLENSFFKKLEDSISLEADERCLKLFKKSNLDCREFVLSPKALFEDQLIGEVKNLFDGFFYRGPDLLLDLSEIQEGFGLGPGASLGAESYNFYSKLFASKLTGTSDQLLRFYRSSISSSPRWVAAENARQSRFGFGMVVGNRLSFVPKTSEVSRSICTEPILNMLFQKGIGAFLEKTLKRRFKIDLSRQPILNRRLAQLGSIDGTYGTIDLSSASDSVSLTLLKELLPPYVLRWLLLARSPSVIYPDGTREELHMVSSMGNAFTFPLQTLLFSSLVVSCYRILGIKPTYDADGPTNFAVFGDDIIVRKDAYAFVTRALKLFGFTVNDGKSFNTGDFRESCGGDYYRGHDIRGVYIKSLKTSADVYSAINRLTRWMARSGTMLPKTISYLLGKVKFLPIPVQDGDAEGIKVPFPPSDFKLDANTGGVIYHALSKVALKFKVPVDPAEVRRYPTGKRGVIFFNPDGLILSFIGGYIRNGRVGIKSDTNRFKIRRRVTSSWGNLTAVGDNCLANTWISVCTLIIK